MTIILRPEHQRLITQAMQTGAYENPDEVVGKALEMLNSENEWLDEHKQEIDPELIASAKVVADSLEQSCAIGDVHHAIARGVMRKEDVYAELSEVVAGKKAGRIN